MESTRGNGRGHRARVAFERIEIVLTPDSASSTLKLQRRANWLDEGRAESEERVAKLGRELPSRLFVQHGMRTIHGSNVRALSP